MVEQEEDMKRKRILPPAVIDGFALFKIGRERKIPGLVLTKVTLDKNSLENGQAALILNKV
jgi:hypothetical protein